MRGTNYKNKNNNIKNRKPELLGQSALSANLRCNPTLLKTLAVVISDDVGAASVGAATSADDDHNDWYAI